MIKIAIILTTSIFIFDLGWQVSAQATTAGYTYNHANAVAYAHKYSCNGSTSYRNTEYISLGSDCANFVSQALFAGGVTMTKSGYGYEQWWYDRYYNVWGYYSDFSQTWVSVQMLSAQLQGTGRATGDLVVDMAGKYSYANSAGGDILMYDWGRGEGYSHVSLSTGREAYEFFNEAGVNYKSITGGSGDSISQHSTDRDHATWN